MERLPVVKSGSTLLRFSRGYKPVSKLVALATASWASHVDFVLPDGRLLGALPGQGVVIHLPRPEARIEYWVAPVAQGWKPALRYLGSPYDWAGALGIYWPGRDWQEPDAWFCSELVAHSLKLAGLAVVRDPVSRVTPGDLLRSPLLFPVTEKNRAPHIPPLKEWVLRRFF